MAKDYDDGVTAIFGKRPNECIAEQVEPHISEWYGMDDTIAFLDVVNPKGYTAEHIKRHVTAEWAKDHYKPTYIGTAGWYVAVVCNDYGRWIANVTVMGYTALQYMRKVEGHRNVG